MSAIRVLMLDDDNHTPSYHAEDASSWHNANHFIKHLTQSHTAIIPYKVRKVILINADIDAMSNGINNIDYFFDIIYFNGRNSSFEEYQEAFNLLWKYSEEL